MTVQNEKIRCKMKDETPASDVDSTFLFSWYLLTSWGFCMYLIRKCVFFLTEIYVNITHEWKKIIWETLKILGGVGKQLHKLSESILTFSFSALMHDWYKLIIILAICKRSIRFRYYRHTFLQDLIFRYDYIFSLFIVGIFCSGRVINAYAYKKYYCYHCFLRLTITA